MNNRNNNNYVWWILLAAAGIGLVAAFGQMTLRMRSARIEAEQQAARQAEETERRLRDVAFGPPSPATETDFAAFGSFFEALGVALQGERPAAVADFFDSERMSAELDRRGFFARFGPGDDDRARDSFTRGFERVGRLVLEDTLYRWDSTRIRRVSWNADRSAALVVATHRLDGRAEPLRLRWWFVSTPQGWKAYDVENFVGGVGLITLLEAASDAEELTKFEEQAVQVRNAVAAALTGYPDIANQLLAPVRGPKLPESLKAPATLAEAFIRLYRGDIKGGLAFLEQAAALNPNLPLLNLGRAIAFARSGDYPRAIRAVDDFAAEYGNDFGIRFWQGFAQEEQGAPWPEVSNTYQLALDDDPNSLLALNGLRRMTGFSPELVKRIGQHRNPVNAYAFLKRASEADGIVFFASQWPDPNDPAGFDLFYDLARVQRVEALYRDKQGLMAYRKLGPVEKTFDELAGYYVRDKDTSGLTKLLAVHADLFPHDPWLDFWHGELLTLQGEFAKATVRYRAFSRNQAASPADRYSASILVVRSWLRAGDAAKANDAVNEIGPEWLPAGVRAAVLAQAGDAAGVERMMAAREKSPSGLAPLYGDEDFSRLIAGTKFADVRKKYPR